MATSPMQQAKPITGKKTQERAAKPPLDRQTLADIVDLALRAGQLLMENGAESQRSLP